MALSRRRELYRASSRLATLAHATASISPTAPNNTREKLSAGGEEGQCGWLKDRYGLSWQINPAILGQMLSDPDPEKSKRVMGSMLKMKKIDIAALKKAYAQQ